MKPSPVCWGGSRHGRAQLAQRKSHVLHRDASILTLADLCPRQTAPGFSARDSAGLSLHRNATLEMWRGGFIPAQDGLLGLEELLRHQHCQGAASHPAEELGAQGKGHSPRGHSKIPPWDKEPPPQIPRPAHKLTDTQRWALKPLESQECASHSNSVFMV